MLTFARRLLVLGALAFWQGGFTFYAAVVVPIGTAILGSAVNQGFITREVTTYLNLAGAVALPVLLWDVVANGETWRKRAPRLALWVGLAVTLLVLAYLHPILAERMERAEPERFHIHERALFRRLHKGYLWTATVQWGFGLLFLAWSVADWRRRDRAPSSVGQAPPDTEHVSGGA